MFSIRSVSATPAIAAFAIAAFAGVAAAQTLPVVPPPEGDRGAPGYAEGSVLVNFKPGATLSEKSQAYAAVGGQKIRGFGLVRGLEQVSLGKGNRPEQAIQTLNRLPFVELAEPDYELHADTNDTYFGLQWGLDNTGQSIRGYTGVMDADIDGLEAWGITTGDPDFIVAVIDTGTDYTHPDLANNIWTNPGEIPGNGVDDDGNGFIDDVHGYDFFSNDGDPMDEEGHGTHVAGTICAEGNNGIGVTGVAWNCKIMPLRFIGPGGGYTSDAIAALSYAVSNGAKLSNNSWGGGGYSFSLYNAIQNAGAGPNGHLFVAASGNSAVDTDASPHYPSSYNLDNIISVAATNNRDELSSFSNFGAASVDVGAPGTDIASTYTILYDYAWASGTSMASPHVTGLAALVWGQNPGWSNLEVKNRILDTARPLAALSGKTVTGGIINAYDALYSPTTPPDAPSALVANVLSHSEIELSWTDNASNESSFKIERRLTGEPETSFVQITSVGADVTNFTDTSLSAETGYDFRVRASNASGDSAYTKIASATTEPAPASEVIVASSDASGGGTVSGTYPDTWVADGNVQSITERESGGKRRDRYSYLEHTWTFQVPAGITTLDLVYDADQSSDGDFFEFSYSIEGGPFAPMADFAADFPPDAIGKVEIRVNDTDQTKGHNSLDTVRVDYIAITSYLNNASVNPPNAPSDLTAPSVGAYQVDLVWIDKSADELGFRIERFKKPVGPWQTAGTVGSDMQSFTDFEVLPQTSYDYQVIAYNAGGDSGPSNVLTVTTLDGPDILLRATGYRDKGWHYVDLDWGDGNGGPSGTFDIFRNGGVIDSNVAATTYLDGAIGKGGASYSYVVCPTGSEPPSGSCSNEEQVTF